MRIIKVTTLREYARKHPESKSMLSAWLLVASRASWQSLVEVRKTYLKTDSAIVASGRFVTVFNIGGNKYRLIVAIHYNTQKIFIRDFMTHAEYTNQKWKGRH